MGLAEAVFRCPLELDATSAVLDRLGFVCPADERGATLLSFTERRLFLEALAFGVGSIKAE